jgi:hypothetical protein
MSRRFRRLLIAVSLSVPGVVAVTAAVPVAEATGCLSGGGYTVPSASQIRTFANLATGQEPNCQVSTAVQIWNGAATWLNSNLYKPYGVLSDKTWFIGGASFLNNGWYTRKV